MIRTQRAFCRAWNMVTWNLDCTQLTTAVFENFLQRKKNVWIKRSSLKIKRVLQPPKKMKSLCFSDVRATKLLLGASSPIMPTCPFVPNQITQKVLNAVSRHTHSMTWNINRHRLRQELKRALRRWQSRAVSGGCLSADAGRDCTISTPAIMTHASRWNTFTMKKRVIMAQFPSKTERHSKAKQKKKQPAPQIPSFAAFTENGRRHNTQTCSLGDGPLSRWRTSRREQREESVG